MLRPRTLGLVPSILVCLALTMPTYARTESHPKEHMVQYRLVKEVLLGGPSIWDYAVYDPASHRVFVAHGNRLTVVNGRSGRVIGQVGPIRGGPHGTAFDQKAGLGITDDGRYGQAIIFNLKSLGVVARLKVQRGADAVAFDPVSEHAFVVDGRTGTIAVIDPVQRRVVAFIHIGGDLEYAVPGDNGQLYVNGVTHHEIFRIDTRTNRIDAKWPMPSCRDPHGLSIDTVAHRLFSSCENSHLVVMNSTNGAVVATVPIGRGSDADRFESRRRLIFSSNGIDGTLSIIREVNPDTFMPVATIPTALAGRTMALDPVSGRVFVVTADVLPTQRKALLSAWEAGRRPKHSPFAPNSLRLLVFDPTH